MKRARTHDLGPAYPCGTALPGLGMGPGPAELLIDLSPPNPLQPILFGPLWAGPGIPSPLSIQIPLARYVDSLGEPMAPYGFYEWLFRLRLR